MKRKHVEKKGLVVDAGHAETAAGLSWGCAFLPQQASQDSYFQGVPLQILFNSKQRKGCLEDLASYGPLVRRISLLLGPLIVYSGPFYLC